MCKCENTKQRKKTLLPSNVYKLYFSSIITQSLKTRIKLLQVYAGCMRDESYKDV